MNNKEIAAKFAGVWGGESLDVIDELADPALTVRYPIMPQPIQGKDAFKKVMLSFRRAFPDAVNRVEDVIAEGDKAVVRWTFTGTQAGNFMGLPATGKKVTWTGITIYTLSGGKVIAEYGEEDFFGFLHQIGFIPPLPTIGR
jgi:steroid delta-isomerase-like uncharacterized protein